MRALDAERLVDYQDMLRRFLLFLTQDPNAADELTQETFAVALAKGPDAAKGDDHGAWLRSIARNLSRNYFRRKRATWLVFDSELLEAAEERFVETESHHDHVWEARREALLLCMRKLSDQDRELLQLRYELLKPVKELARERRVKPNALSKRLQRIRDRLRKCIQSVLEGDRSDG